MSEKKKNTNWNYVFKSAGFKSTKDEEKSQQLILKGILIPVSVLIILGAFSFFLVKTKYKSYQVRCIW